MQPCLGTFFVPVFFSRNNSLFVALPLWTRAACQRKERTTLLHLVLCAMLHRQGWVGVEWVGWGEGEGKVVSAIKVVALDCSFIDFFTRVDFYGFLLPGWRCSRYSPIPSFHWFCTAFTCSHCPRFSDFWTANKCCCTVLTFCQYFHKFPFFSASSFPSIRHSV